MKTDEEILNEFATLTGLPKEVSENLSSYKHYKLSVRWNEFLEEAKRVAVKIKTRLFGSLLGLALSLSLVAQPPGDPPQPKDSVRVVPGDPSNGVDPDNDKRAPKVFKCDSVANVSQGSRTFVVLFYRKRIVLVVDRVKPLKKGEYEFY